MDRARRRRILAAVWVPPALAVAGLVLLLRTRAAGDEGAPYRLPLFAAANPDAEIAFVEERIRRNPDGALDLAALAALLAKKGDLGRAERMARESLERLPFSNEGAKRVLAQVAQTRHDFDEAIRLCRDVLRTRPQDPDTLGLLATACLGAGRVDEAMPCVDDLAARRPSLSSIALRATALEACGRDREALHEYVRAIGRDEPGEAEASSWARAMLGRFHLRRGRLGPARAILREAVRIHPENAAALGHLADAERRLGERTDAERHASMAFQLSRDPAHLVLRARIKEDGSELRAAAERMLRAEGARGHRRLLAELLLERRADAEALALMQDDVKRRRDPETLAVLAWALSRAGRHGEARAAIGEALRTGVRDARLYARAAAVEQAAGDRRRARLYRDCASEVDPAHEEALP